MKQKYTEKKKESNRRWDENNIERITVAVPKGKKKIIKEHATAKEESISGFVNRAIDEAIERDKRNATATR